MKDVRDILYEETILHLKSLLVVSNMYTHKLEMHSRQWPLHKM